MMVADEGSRLLLTDTPLKGTLAHVRYHCMAEIVHALCATNSSLGLLMTASSVSRL